MINWTTTTPKNWILIWFWIKPISRNQSDKTKKKNSWNESIWTRPHSQMFYFKIFTFAIKVTKYEKKFFWYCPVFLNSHVIWVVNDFWSLHQVTKKSYWVAKNHCKRLLCVCYFCWSKNCYSAQMWLLTAPQRYTSWAPSEKVQMKNRHLYLSGL